MAQHQKRRRHCAALAGGLFFILVSVTLVWAQAYTSLQGVVTDPAGAVIAGATVTLTNVDTGVRRVATTGDDGGYRFTQVPPGTYTVKVEMAGFKTVVRPQVVLLVATPYTLNVPLEVGQVTETVEVTAAPATINVSDATIGVPYGELQVKQLPLAARNPVGLLSLQPGVTFVGETNFDLLQAGANVIDPRDGAVNGVRGDQNNVTLDGIDVNDQQNQSAFYSVLPITLDSLREFRVTTTNSNAAQGRSAGAQVALVTKSGSNTWHGAAYWFHRNTKTAANDFFNNLSGVRKAKLIRNIWGFDTSGPIVKNRAFFFWNLEQRRDASEANVLRIVPSEPLKRGILRYRSTTGQLISLTPEQFMAIDPGCAATPSPGCGVNPAMLAWMNQFPAGNDPSQGLDAGLNFTGLRFTSPITVNNQVYTARFDFNLDRQGKHTIFWRGILGDLKRDILPAQLPGQSAAAVLLNNSKGFVLSYTGQFSPTIVNTFRWGLTRQGIEQTGGGGARFAARSFDTPVPFNRGFGRAVPTHNLVDDFTWLHNTHTIQVGANVRFVRNERFSFANSFPDFFINNGFATNLGREPLFALQDDDDPNNDPADVVPFVRAFMALTGSITQVDATFFVDPQTAENLPQGLPQAREFASNEFEFYGQDTWRARPNLTLTFGLRYSYYSPIWETGGLQVRPSVNLRAWWNQRQLDMFNGVPANRTPDLPFVLAGKANGQPAWWHPDKDNFAPRFAFAYSPGFQSGFLHRLFGGPGRTSIRGGYGLFFAKVGGALSRDFDLNGSVGLSNTIFSPVGFFGIPNAPRFSGTLPPLEVFLNIPQPGFPAVPNNDSSGVGFLVDTNLSTPYSQNIDFSIERELPHGIVVRASYVGTFGHQLLTKIDLGSPLIRFRDPASGTTLEQAYNQIVDSINAGTPPSTPIPFFENVFARLSDALNEAGFGAFAGATNTESFFNIANAFAPSWTDALFFLDITLPLRIGASPYNPALGTSQVFFQRQFQTLPTWTNAGSSNYHGFQFTVRKSVGDSQFAINYTLSKSIDNGSRIENTTQFGGQIPDAFRTGAHRAVSDFDVRHQFNANWIVQMPFGRGRTWGNHVAPWLNHIIGGWQVEGLWRIRSGFPISVGNGFNFPTNFFLTGPGTLTRKIETKITRNVDGFPNLFRNPQEALKAVTFTRPGDVGTRNALRTGAFFSVDLGIAKRWHMPWFENHWLQFRWEAFNLFNNVNFDSDNIDLDPESPSTFGRIFSVAQTDIQGSARVMQFAIRYDF